MMVYIRNIGRIFKFEKKSKKYVGSRSPKKRFSRFSIFLRKNPEIWEFRVRRPGNLE